MLDNDLADIYEVETKALKRAVRRNLERFPEDFMFEPTMQEIETLRCQIGTSKVENFSEADTRPCLRSQIVTSKPESKSIGRGGNRYTPFAFTELGVAMLSSVLGSERAIEINIEIMRAFVQLRKQPKVQQLDWVPKFESLESELKMLRQKFNQFETQSRNEKPQDPVSMIQNIVARHWGLKIEDFKSARRTKAISLPRQIAIYLIRKQMQMSFSEIGTHFGQRDHTTILYACRKIEAAYAANSMIQETLNFLASEIKRQERG